MRTGLVLGSMVLLAGCGSSGNNPPKPPVNSAPTFVSAAAVTVAENVTGNIYQANATDPDGDVVTYAISGVDAARFTMTAQGALSFNVAPDFESPGDQNADNIYNLVITASDGKSPKELQFTVTVTNAADRVGTVQVGTGYVDAVQSVGLPGGDDLLVAQQDGRIYLLDPATGGTGSLFLTVGDVGRLLSIALAPDFATSGDFYVSLLNTALEFEVRRYRRQNATSANPASADTVLSFARSAPANVGGAVFGGWIGFGPDGYLYMATADNSAGPNAQSLASLEGKILRVDLRTDAFPADARRDYSIPADNPFAAGAAPEVYAYGFRDPRRASFNGSDLLVGDNLQPLLVVGGEINLVRPQDKGANYGWGAAGGTPGLIRTAIEWRGNPATMGAGTNVTGGRVYRGPISELVGLYVFYEDVLQRYFSVAAANIRQDGHLVQDDLTIRTDIRVPSATQPGPRVVSVDEDANFNLILVTATGVFRVEKF